MSINKKKTEKETLQTVHGELHICRVEVFPAQGRAVIFRSGAPLQLQAHISQACHGPSLFSQLARRVALPITYSAISLTFHIT